MFYQKRRRKKMIKEVAYQTEAVNELVAKTIKLLNVDGSRKRLVFKAPTGSGKTVMASKMLDVLTAQFEEDNRAVAFIWIAPNKLHQQSYMRMKNYFSETNELNPVMYDELDHSTGGYIKRGEVFFVNWESIRMDKNVMVRDTENSSSIYDIVRRSKEEYGMQVIVVIDEEHMFAGRAAKQAEKVLHNIDAKVEIRISATPITQPDEMVSVDRSCVIKEEMIKDGITINPKVEAEDNGVGENAYLLDQAMKRREEIKEAYNQLGVRINPLLLIQLPNDTAETLDDQERTIIEMVKSRLDAEYGITTANGRLAIWLSNEKQNLEGLEDNYNHTEVLLFKQAIALGWDCPRAAVLLIFRDIQSTTFGVQTVGRIMRMPEQRYYPNGLLNHGWVYTNLSKNKIEIVAEDINYISKAMMAYRRSNLANIKLPSVYSEYLSADRNRLGPDFWNVLVETFNNRWFKQAIQQNLFAVSAFASNATANSGFMINVVQNRRQAEAVGIDFANHTVRIDMVKNVDISGDAGITMVSKEQQIGYGRSQEELSISFTKFCQDLLGGYEKISATSLRGYIYQLMEEYLGVFETDVPRTILYHQNKPKFAAVIGFAINKYTQIINKRRADAKKRSFKSYEWEVPELREYNEATNREVEEVEEHALLPFIQLKIASKPEVRFEEFLENNKESIDWWYKNGDEGKQHYAVEYIAQDETHQLFYVDFVIRMKNGQIFLFDTKSVGSDLEADKHNALWTYMNETHKEKNLKGGILIEDTRTGNWMYSPMKIENTEDIVNWNAFYPQDYKN